MVWLDTPENANRCSCIINGVQSSVEEKKKFNDRLLNELTVNEELEPLTLCSPNLESSLNTLLRTQRQHIDFNENQFSNLFETFNLIDTLSKKKAKTIVQIFENISFLLEDKIEEYSLYAMSISTKTTI